MAPPAVRFRGGTVAVSSPDIASLTLVKPLPALARVYIGPWIPAYILSYYAFYHAYDTYIKSIGEYLTLLSQRVARLFRMSLHRSVALFETRWPCMGRTNWKGPPLHRCETPVQARSCDRSSQIALRGTEPADAALCSAI